MSELVAPGGWHPDPLGRHEFRWWDGAIWTANVSDRGVAAVDPAGLGVAVASEGEPGTAVPTPITRTAVDALLPQVQNPNDFGLPSRPVIASRTYASPMSYVGSTRRLVSWAQRVGQSTPAMSAVAWTLAAFSIAAMWFLILPVWYFVTVFLFGWLLIPFRLFRRSSRKQQHVQETQLATMQVLLQQQQAASQRSAPQQVTVVTQPSSPVQVSPPPPSIPPPA